MSRVPIPHVNSYRARGQLFHYYRRGAVRMRLRGEPGGEAWAAAYREAEAAYAASCVKAEQGQARARHGPGTIGALIVSYRCTTSWQQLKPATRRDYEKGLGWLEAHHAHGPVATMERPQVIRLRELAAWQIDSGSEPGQAPVRTLVPSRANKMLAVLSILLEHAIDRGWRRDNPAKGVRKIKVGGEGYRPWSGAEVAGFLAHHADDTFWTFALTLALCTGQRGQDQVRMTWGAYDGRSITVAQEKTEAELRIAVHPRLKAMLDARRDELPREGLFLLMRPDRRSVRPGQAARPMTPWPANAFQHAAGAAIAAAGLKGVVWHGLRATAASWMADGGCSDAEIMAVTGHKTSKMVQHYRRGAEQTELGSAAVAKLQMRHDQASRSRE